MSINTLSIATALRSLKDGDLAVRLPESEPATREIAVEFNRLADQLQETNREIRRVCKELSVDGRFGGQIDTLEVQGDWDETLTEFNEAARTLTIQVRAASKVVEARAGGDIGTILTASAAGEMRLLFELVNSIGKEPAGSF